MRRMKILSSTLLLPLIFALSPAIAQETTLSIRKFTIHAEIADTPHSRARGLMQRNSLCADCGMLFVFDKPARYDFWMKNTSLPLSIAFIAADGGIINIDEMQPNTTDNHSAQGEALYALEMNSGWFARHGVAPRDRVQGLPRTH